MCVLGPNYMPVQVSMLTKQSKLEFDLYQEIGGKPQLFKGRNLPLLKLDLKSLERRRCDVLYISTAQKGAYIDSLSRNLTHVLANDNLTVHVKVELLSQISETILDDVLRAPMSGDVVGRAVRQCAHHVSFASQSPDAHKALVMHKSDAPFPIAHAVAVSNLSILLGYRCGVESTEKLQQLGVGALLHEVGKTILDPNYYKRPASRRPLGNTRLKNYPRIGRDMMSKTGAVPYPALKPIAEHQERMDGSGFPSHLCGKQIDFMSRIVAICDMYDEAMRGFGAEKPPSPFQVLRRMRLEKGKYDDTILVEFIKMLGEDFAV